MSLPEEQRDPVEQTQPKGIPERATDESAKEKKSLGFESSDVRASGVLVFLTVLALLVVAVGVVAYGLGKALDLRLAWEDRQSRQNNQSSRWNQPSELRSLGNMPSSPQLQNKVAETTNRFPAPRLETDDGSQATADLHAREELLLEHYSWVDPAAGKVRIPVERAMQILAARGLAVAPAAAGSTPALAGETRPTVAAPLTDGFAPTGYEQEQAEKELHRAGVIPEGR